MILTDAPELDLDTDNATDFDANDVSGCWEADYQELRKKTYFKYLKEMNEGRRHNYINTNSQYDTKNQLAEIAEIVSDRLQLNSASTSRVLPLLQQLNRQKLGLRLEHVAHAVALFIVRHDERDERTVHPASDDRHGDFTEFEDAIGIENLASVYEIVASRLR